MTSGVMPTSLLCLPVENYMPLAEARTTKAETRTFLRQNRVLFKHLIIFLSGSSVIINDLKSTVYERLHLYETQ